MIQKKFYKTIKVLVDGDGGEMPFYIENIDTQAGTFKMTEGGDRWSNLDLYYRLDNGNWTKYNIENNHIGVEVQPGQKLYLKGDNPQGFGNSLNSSARFQLRREGTPLRCNVGGYITSLMASMNSKAITTIPDNAFAWLLGGTYEGDTLKVISAKDMRTDNIKTVNNSSFQGLFCWNVTLVDAPSFSNVRITAGDAFDRVFTHCRSLVIAPTFENVEIVGYQSFQEAFTNCTSLVTAPTFEKLTTIGGDATFRYAFQNCTSLVTAPIFGRVTKCTQRTFESIFKDCTSLQVPPTFENLTGGEWYCLIESFKGCTALKVTPNLRNYHLNGCEEFNEAFMDCTSLQTIYAPRGGWWDVVWVENTTNNWVNGVSANGTFYKRRGLDIPTGVNGIPEGWNVIEED